MGYFGKIEQKILAQTLRKKGLSYREILLQVSVSKDTLSRWCKDIQLSQEQKQRLLQNKQFGQKKGSLVAAENKRNKRLNTITEINRDAKKEIGDVTNRDKFMLGIALYSGEGYKMDGKIGFTNADPKVIVFMMDWFLIYGKIPLQKIHGAIWLHEDLNEQKAKDFWSNLTGIPQSQFHKTYIARNRLDSKKIRKNIHEYGIFSIRIADTQLHRKIMGWIYAVLDDKITNTFRLYR